MLRTRSRRAVLAGLCIALGTPAALAAEAGAELAAEPLGQVATLAPADGAHRVWLGDLMLHRSALFDVDHGRLLGQLSSGTSFGVSPHPSPDGREIYLASTFYSRGTRGDRTDVVSVFDASTLLPVAEVEIPPKRGDPASGYAISTLSDDGRYLLVANMTPATSLSVVDVRERRFTAEIETPGCALVFAAGARRFFSLCGDGTALVVEIDDAGRERSKARSERFFDAELDPVIEKGVRLGDQWLFASFEGQIRTLDLANGTAKAGPSWPLFDGSDLEAGWRVGGMQPLALHAASGRLHVLVHVGGKDTHKQPGTEIWSYDVAKRARIQRTTVRNPNASFLRGQLQLDETRRIDRAISWLLERLLPNPGADRIAVTSDASPLLVTSTSLPSTLIVHDGTTGAFLRDVSETGIAGNLLVAP